MEIALKNYECVVEEEQLLGQEYVHLVPARGALLIGCCLAGLQCVDGLLTSIGISRFGLEIEGNPFLRHLMEDFGHIPTLAVMKLLAIFLIVGLTLLSSKLPWVKNAMGAVSFIYFVAAIVPWTYILFLKPLL